MAVYSLINISGYCKVKVKVNVRLSLWFIL